MPFTVASAPEIVVTRGTLYRIAVDLIEVSSCFVALLLGVFIIKFISPDFILSTTLGLPSCSLGTISTSRLFLFNALAVPVVAKILNPRSDSFLATNIIFLLSSFLTLIKIFPFTGSFWPAAICDLANAIPSVLSMPITSPVDFISGPNTGSTPGKRTNGNTDSLTHVYFIFTSFVNPSSFNVEPSIIFVASFANGTPIAFETKGIVLDARGLTSSI